MSSFPFRVEYGYRCERGFDFATFYLALAFYRALVGSVRLSPELQKKYEPRLVNIDNIDGAEDSSAAAQHGLTAEQWEQVEAVG